MIWKRVGAPLAAAALIACASAPAVESPDTASTARADTVRELPPVDFSGGAVKEPVLSTEPYTEARAAILAGRYKSDQLGGRKVRQIVRQTFEFSPPPSG